MSLAGNMALTFPGGYLKTVTVAATNGNEVTNKSPGTGKRWRILYGSITLVCDATVATRAIRTQLTDGSNVLTEIHQTPGITASQTRTLSYAPGGYNSEDISAANDYVTTLGNLAIIEGDDQLRITIGSGVAGDSYSGRFRVQEFGL